MTLSKFELHDAVTVEFPDREARANQRDVVLWTLDGKPTIVATLTEGDAQDLRDEILGIVVTWL